MNLYLLPYKVYYSRNYSRRRSLTCLIQVSGSKAIPPHLSREILHGDTNLVLAKIAGTAMVLYEPGTIL